jgi:hypothetical protein
LQQAEEDQAAVSTLVGESGSLLFIFLLPLLCSPPLRVPVPYLQTKKKRMAVMTA